MSGLEGNGQVVVVLVFLKFGVSGTEGEQSIDNEESPPAEELGGQSVGEEERCRAPLPETPPAESATESARV